MREGGQVGFKLTPPESLTERVYSTKRSMLWGYGTFMVCIVIILVITAVWGPIVMNNGN